MINMNYLIGRKEMITASITIYDENNRIDDIAMAKLFERIFKDGADGFFVGGSVGECFLLSDEERIHLFELASRYINRGTIYAHVGTIGTEHAVHMAKAAKSMGIKNIGATPPFYFGFTPKEVAQYYYDLAEAIDGPVLYYDIPSSTHKDLDTDNSEIKALLQSGAINAIKHTNLLSYRAKKIRELNPGIKIMGGFESRVIPMLNYHCDGFIGSTFNFMLPQYNKIVEMYDSPDKAPLFKIVSDSVDILQLLLDLGLPASIKHILSQQGLYTGPVRKPLLPLNDEAKRKLDKALEEKLIYR